MISFEINSIGGPNHCQRHLEPDPGLGVAGNLNLTQPPLDQAFSSSFAFFVAAETGRAMMPARRLSLSR
jgi:hypothetical protein